jgi:ATP-dependent DNA helicase RecG
MTATPIPRTVAMTVFGDLETSTLAELPTGRAGVSTHVVPSSERPRYLERMWQRVREEVASGGRAFVVCPRIGDDVPVARVGDEEVGGDGPGAAVVEWHSRLADDLLPDLRVGMLHGRMPSADKDDVMRQFARGDLDVLVATTVIEVGVDVPEATAMVVLDADRFGVSQLHQLRGRVGRGSAPAICFLVTDQPAGSPARDRLEAVAATTDGFELARVDLEQRREGDVLGASQSGRRSSLKLLRVIRDEEIIAVAREEATALVDADPQLEKHEALREAIDRLVDADRAEFLDRT